ncbi:META domain-containing protein [Micromonospora sp. NPDC049799]|uniref:META domain-containing protein n=1 Tax=Micromonospora sp. NPDC049799 TaxID=3154741 RepID=UPI0033FEB75B
MRRGRYALGIVALTMLLTACAGGEPAPPSQTLPLATPVATVEPTDLVGSWAVTGTGVEAGTVLRLGDGELVLFRDCDASLGAWAAHPGGLFVADLHGLTNLGDDRCGPAGSPALPDWLARADRFEVDGVVRVLLDRAGVEVARLSPGARPSVPPNMDPARGTPPAVTDETRAWLASPAPLPSALAPVARNALTGRWLPLVEPGRGREAPHVVLADDGTWRGSDGCNNLRGRWTTGPDGALVATAAPQTLIGCDGTPLATWLGYARRAGLDDDVLVLVNAKGTEIGRLRRDG